MSCSYSWNALPKLLSYCKKGSHWKQLNIFNSIFIVKGNWRNSATFFAVSVKLIVVFLKPSNCLIIYIMTCVTISFLRFILKINDKGITGLFIGNHDCVLFRQIFNFFVFFLFLYAPKKRRKCKQRRIQIPFKHLRWNVLRK